MLVAAAFCPHPPLLVPEAMGGPQPGGDLGGGDLGGGDPGGGDLGGGDMDAVRAACDAAVAGLLAARPSLVVAVGGADVSGEYAGSAAGSLHDYGVSFVTGTGEPVLPLSLTIAAWLLRRAGAQAPARGAGPGQPRVLLRAVARSTAPAECLRLGAEIARREPSVAVLAMGEASARRAVGVPGAADPAADSYDAGVAAALSAADADWLAGLPPALDDELMVSGRPSWQVLAGAARGGRYRGRLLYAARPHAVSYLIASWEACCTRS